MTARLSKLWLPLLLILTIPSIWALFVPGYFGASDDIHIAWLFEMDKIVRLGQIPPRYAPDLNYGFGYPLFNFVYPLPFYLGEVLHVLGLNFVDSIKGVFLLSTIFSTVFMHQFLKTFLKKEWAFFGSIMYLYAPYRATEIYIRGAIGEIVSFMFLPLVALSVVKITDPDQKKSVKWMALGGLSVAGLVLTHNIATYMFLPFIGVLGLLRWFILSKKNLNSLFSFLGMFGLGLLISLYFWLPALLDNSLMKSDTGFDFRDHFPTLKQLVTPYFGYGASVPGPFDGISFFLGYAGVLVPILALALGVWKWKSFRKDKKILIAWSFVSYLVVIFIMNFRSTYLWFHIPLLPYFQFPWRFLIMTCFLTPVFLVTFESLKIKPLFIYLAAIILVSLSFNYYKPHDFLGRTDQYFINRYIPYPEASEAYRQVGAVYFPLPKQNEKIPDNNYPTVFPENPAITDIRPVNAMSSLIHVNASQPLTINYNKFLMPGWEARANGQKLELSPGSPFGQIQMILPKGEYDLEVYFKETPLKLLLDLISLLALLISSFAIFWHKKLLKPAS